MCHQVRNAITNCGQGVAALSKMLLFCQDTANHILGLFFLFRFRNTGDLLGKTEDESPSCKIIGK